MLNFLVCGREQEGKGDPLEKYCGDNPEADECRCASLCFPKAWVCLAGHRAALLTHLLLSCTPGPAYLCFCLSVVLACSVLSAVVVLSCYTKPACLYPCTFWRSRASSAAPNVGLPSLELQDIEKAVGGASVCTRTRASRSQHSLLPGLGLAAASSVWFMARRNTCQDKDGLER